MALHTVRVPKELEAAFLAAEQKVEKQFGDYRADTGVGTIQIGGERYILVRAAAMSVDFLDFVQRMYPSLDGQEVFQAASIVQYDLAQGLGLSDARKSRVPGASADPMAVFSEGPVRFACTGWGHAEILPESRLSPSEDILLLVNHDRTFESDAWIASGRKTESCCCFMSAGYAAGWCEESFGVRLVSRELRCRARGDEVCRFLMAHPDRIEGHVADWLRKNP